MPLRLSGFVPFLLILLVSACNKPLQSKDEKQAVNLKDRAVEIMYTKPDSALYYLNQATALNPAYSLAYTNKADVLIVKGDNLNAIKALKKAIEIKPESAETILFLGMLYEYTGSAKPAQKQYQKALEIFDNRIRQRDENLFNNKGNRAFTLILLDQNSEAEKEINQLLKEDPNNLILQMLLTSTRAELFSQLFPKRK